jgi:hypothetical protein
VSKSPSKSNSIRLAIGTIVAHAVFSSLHGAAHQNLGVRLSQLQVLFVAVVITIAPILAGILLWKGFRKIGAILLVISMMGSFIFGVYNHFIGISPDHVSHLEITTTTNWVWLFQTTAVLIAIIEASGVWVGMQVLRDVQEFPIR